MINRSIIRARVLQVLYAHLHRGEAQISSAEADLKIALARTYDLYLYLMRLPVSIAHCWEELVELRCRKHLASPEERNPLYRPLNNLYIQTVGSCPRLEGWYHDFALAWEQDQTLLRHFVEQIERSDIYQEYLRQETSFQNDRSFWVQVFVKIIAPSSALADYLEAQSLYWESGLMALEKIHCEERPGLDEEDILRAIAQAQAEDSYASFSDEYSNVEVVKSFVAKTMRRTEAPSEASAVHPLEICLLPQYRDESDEVFAQHLLRQTLVDYSATRELMTKHLSSGWDRERLADVDRLIIHQAVTEFLHFPSILTAITINEYVELSKHYSTPKSPAFVNGVLDAIAKELKTERKILKA